MFAQMWLCMHEWSQSWLMTICFRPIIIKLGMWVYNDCEKKKNIYIYIYIIYIYICIKIYNDTIRKCVGMSATPIFLATTVYIPGFQGIIKLTIK